jgi:hypothetical protein
VARPPCSSCTLNSTTSPSGRERTPTGLPGKEVSPVGRDKGCDARLRGAEGLGREAGKGRQGSLPPLNGDECLWCWALSALAGLSAAGQGRLSLAAVSTINQAAIQGDKSLVSTALTIIRGLSPSISAWSATRDSSPLPSVRRLDWRLPRPLAPPVAGLLQAQVKPDHLCTCSKNKTAAATP